MTRVRPLAAAALLVASGALLAGAARPAPSPPAPAGPSAPASFRGSAGAPADFPSFALTRARPAQNPKGYAVHIACEEVDPNSYKGVVPKLGGPLRDLKFVQAVAKARGYEEVRVLVGKTDDKEQRATRANVLKALKDAGEKAEAGDIVLVTYSGHGGRIPDEGADPDEKSGQDNVWTLYDGMLVDDEVGMALSKYRAGVRVVVVLDSCHSETAVKGTRLTAKDYRDLAAAKAANPSATTKDLIAANQTVKDKLAQGYGPAADQGYQIRALDQSVETETYFANQAFYKDLATKYNSEEAIRNPEKAAPSVLTLAACRDEQVSIDLGTNGLYTAELKRLWENGWQDKSYDEYDTKLQVVVPFRASAKVDKDGAPLVQVPRMTPSKVPSFTGGKIFSIK